MLTIDVEDYFQVHAFSKCVRYQDWGNYECRVERNTYRLLDILDAAVPTPVVGPLTPYAKATFFVLGWVAERYPILVKEIKARGHEVASHGCNHQIISAMSPEQFREDIHKSKSILEDLTGDAVIGYRAPNYSMGDQQLWALEILAEEGYQYDSSIYPIHHDTYGMPDAPRFPFTIVFNGNGNSSRSAPDSSWAVDSSPCALRLKPYADFFTEFPLSTVRLFNVNIPVSGGGYFRLFPYQMVKKGLRRINREEERPFIFFLHPWEIDAEQPRIRGAGVRSTVRHYLNIKRTERKFRSLLKDFQFTSIQAMIDNNKDMAYDMRLKAYGANNKKIVPVVDRLTT